MLGSGKPKWRSPFGGLGLGRTHHGATLQISPVSHRRALNRMGIRAYLAGIVAVLLIPAAVIAAFGLAHAVRAERAAEMRHALEVARSISLAADQPLIAAQANLRALAASAALRAGDLAGFQVEISALHDIEAPILLLDREGSIAAATESSSGQVGARYPLGFDRLAAGEETSTGSGSVYASRVRDGSLVVVGLPIQISADRYILLQSIPVGNFRRIVAGRETPAAWSIILIDRNKATIADTHGTQDAGDEHRKEAVLTAASTEREGQLRYPAQGNVSAYQVFTRSPQSGWLVSIGVPATLGASNTRRTAMFGALALFTALVLAVLIVHFFARRIKGALASLAHAADAIARDDPLPPNVPAFAEADALRAQLERIAVALKQAKTAHATEAAERLQLLEATQAARESAEQQNQAKDQFLSMLGHELRNPLSAISGAVAVMKHTPIEDEQCVQAREVIGRQTQHLSRVVDDLLDLNHVMTGDVALEKEPLDLAEVAAACLASMHATGRITSRQVSTRLESVWIDADRTRLEQVVSNLVANAVKLSANDARIELRVSREDQDAVLCIRDIGRGIPPHLVPHVFDLFLSGESSSDRAKGRIGIGLALVRRLVHLHGGTVSAESSTEARGMIFTVRLPRLVPPATETVHATPVCAPPHALRVLIVDDHEDSRTMLRMLLEQTGHEAIEAVDGVDGLQFALSRRPDVAIVDIGLPGMNGYEVVRRLRAVPGGPDTVMIALTGYGQEADRQRALQAGFDIHLVKPVDAERLAQALVTVSRTRFAEEERRP